MTKECSSLHYSDIIHERTTNPVVQRVDIALSMQQVLVVLGWTTFEQIGQGVDNLCAFPNFSLETCDSILSRRKLLQSAVEIHEFHASIKSCICIYSFCFL